MVESIGLVSSSSSSLFLGKSGLDMRFLPTAEKASGLVVVVVVFALSSSGSFRNCCSRGLDKRLLVVAPSLLFVVSSRRSSSAWALFRRDDGALFLDGIMGDRMVSSNAVTRWKVQEAKK
jgi:hypothetical protein